MESRRSQYPAELAKSASGWRWAPNGSRCWRWFYARDSGWGLAPGLLGAFALPRFLRTLLFRAAATDPATYVGVCCLLIVTALGACWLPALRATRIDPMAALRGD